MQLHVAIVKDEEVKNNPVFAFIAGCDAGQIERNNGEMPYWYVDAIRKERTNSGDTTIDIRTLILDVPDAIVEQLFATPVVQLRATT